MTAARSPRRRKTLSWAGAVAFAALLAVPAPASAQVGGGRDIGGDGFDWRTSGRLSPTGRRMAAARLAQRERDAGRRRDAARRRNRYSFGQVPAGPGAAPAVPGAALDAPGPETAVRVLVLADGANGVLESRGWREAFAALGVPVQVRTAAVRDEPGVTESTRAGLRSVVATGVLTPGGGLSFGETAFGPGDARKLRDWVRDLTTHGAAGSPAGKPLWGLSRPAFAAVLASLSEPAPAAFAGAGGGTLGAALSALELPPDLPVRVTPGAEAVLAGPDAAAAPGGRLPVLSRGTALAVVLAKRGLAFRPTRRPDGSVELTVIPRPGGDDEAGALPGSAVAEVRADAAPPAAWPVGWEIGGGADRLRAVGSLYAVTTVGVREAPLADFAVAAGDAAGVPVVLDDAALAAAGVDGAKTLAAVPPGRGTWAKALRYALAEHRLVGRLRRDEAGRGFLWVVPARR